MSISIGAGYDLPEEKHRVRSREEEAGGQESERIAVVDDLNDKLQASVQQCFCFGVFQRQNVQMFAGLTRACDIVVGVGGLLCPRWGASCTNAQGCGVPCRTSKLFECLRSRPLATCFSRSKSNSVRRGTRSTCVC